MSPRGAVQCGSREHREIELLLDRGFYSIAFQPIVTLSQHAVFGFEGLLRGPEGTSMAKPQKLFHEPGFLPKSLLHRLDRHCLEQALRTGRALAGKYSLFLNIHGETLWSEASETRFLFSLFETLGVNPSSVVLEISETTDKAHVRAIARSLRPFRREGVRVALDDVGAKYPWLHHLLWLEPDCVKVERSFIKSIHREPRKQQLVYALVEFAKKLGARIVAEGVEQEEELTALCGLNVAMAQGFFIGRPMSAAYWAMQLNPSECCQTASPVAGVLE